MTNTIDISPAQPQRTVSGIQRLTLDELRAFPVFADYSDEAANAVIDTLFSLSTLLFQFSLDRSGTLVDNQFEIVSTKLNNITAIVLPKAA